MCHCVDLGNILIISIFVLSSSYQKKIDMSTSFKTMLVPVEVHRLLKLESTSEGVHLHTFVKGLLTYNPDTVKGYKGPRKAVNIDADTHKELKLRAIKAEVAIGDYLHALLQEYKSRGILD